jgi:hypothetical protein
MLHSHSTESKFDFDPLFGIVDVKTLFSHSQEQLVCVRNNSTTEPIVNVKWEALRRKAKSSIVEMFEIQSLQ